MLWSYAAASRTVHATALACGEVALSGSKGKLQASVHGVAAASASSMNGGYGAFAS